MVNAHDALSILERLRSNDILVWLTGGWGIDALLREETRPHKDLDLIMLLDDVARMCDLLARDGYQLKEFWSENVFVVDPAGAETPTAFVLHDSEGHQVDAHAMLIDEQGNGIPAWNSEEGLIFRPEDLAGSGAIAGVSVSCISPAMQAVCHSGYAMPDFQIQDMTLLHQRYGLDKPSGMSDPA